MLRSPTDQFELQEYSAIDMMTCPSCGAPTDKGAAFCIACGSRVDSQSSAPSPLFEKNLFFQTLGQRLNAQGFTISKGVVAGKYVLDLLAIRSSFEGGVRGRWGRFIMAKEMKSADIKTVQDFSDAVTENALDPENADVYPRTYYKGFASGLLLIPTIASDDFDEDLKQWMSKTLAKKHWAAFEFPVLVSLKSNELFYCRKTPFWGAANYSGFRKFVEETFRIQDKVKL